MLNRIKTLVLMQLGNKMKVSKLTNKKRFALTVFLLSLLAIGICGILVFALNFVKNTLFLPVNMGMLTFVMLISQLISIIVCTNSLMFNLYKSKDNAILLSYPANHNEVFLSKLIIAYMGELKKNAFFLLPLLIAFGIVSGGGVLFFIYSILFYFVLPFFAVAIGALFSIPLMYVKRFLDKVPLVYLLLVVGLVVLIFIGLNSFVASIPKPLRLVAIYNQFVSQFTSFIVSANKYALFYTFFTNVLYGTNFWLSSLYLILISGGLIALVYYASMPFYFRLASRSGENTIKKQRHKANSKQRSVFRTYLKKEMLFTSRNSNLVINNYILILAMPLILYVMNVVCSAIMTSPFGNNMIAGFNVIVAGILIFCSNTQSASVITVEGSEIALLKTAPSNTRNMVYAKMFVNFVVSTILVLIGCVVLSVFNVLEQKTIWCIFVILLFLNYGHILWSFQLDVINPQLRDYAETGKLDGNKNVGFSMTLGLIISLLMGFVTIFLLEDNAESAWAKLIGIALAFFVVRIYFFIRNMSVYFKRIEY